jgi:DUF2911 family protein
MNRFRILASILGALMLATLCAAQSAVLDLPLASQHAVVTQRIGITDVTINYHRPLVAGRKIWDGIVPYGQVWRAGANENTTIAFADPVSIEGKPLDRGTYGLHMIPATDAWTVIFSKNSTAWGSFTYKQDEDALRVTVKPQPAEMREALTYDFDQVTPDSAVVTMRWEKVAVPFKVGVDVNHLVAASLRNQLRGLSQYTWEGWDDAATYLLTSKTDLEDALKYSDNSIQNEERYDNLMTKSRVLDALGRKQEASTARDKALARANAVQSYMYARQLQRDHHADEAFAIYRSNAKKFPNEWITHAGVARVYAGQGDYDNAVKEMKLCMEAAPDIQKPGVEGLVKRLQAKEDINK